MVNVGGPKGWEKMWTDLVPGWYLLVGFPGEQYPNDEVARVEVDRPVVEDRRDVGAAVFPSDQDWTESSDHHFSDLRIRSAWAQVRHGLDSA